MTGLNVQRWAWYHLGLKNISRSHLSYVNARRDYRIYQNLYYHLFSRCLAIAPKHRFKFNNPLKVLDSTWSISASISFHGQVPQVAKVP